MLVILLIAASCEREELVPPVQENTEAVAGKLKTEVAYYTKSEAQEKIAHLYQVMNKTPIYGFSARDSAIFSWGYIDKTKVMQIRLQTDSIYTINTTYRIRRYEDKHPNAFINLVLSENKYRQTLTLYGYIMSPRFARAYLNEGASLKDFEGLRYAEQLQLDPDIANCPNEMVIIQNPELGGGGWSGGGVGDINMPAPGDGSGQNFGSDFGGIADGAGGGGGDYTEDENDSGGGGNRGGYDSERSLWWIKLGNVAEDVWDALGDAWDWLTGRCNCGPKGIVAPDQNMQLDGDGFVVIDQDRYNPENPENPYTPGDYGGDPCHNLAVGVLADLYSYEFIAKALSVEGQTQVTVEDVAWMKNHPELSVPAILFLEQERFVEPARLYFYPQLLAAQLNTPYQPILYRGVFLNYYFNLDESSEEYQWLTTEATQNELNKLTDYLANNEYSQESIAFVVEAVKVLMNGGVEGNYIMQYLNAYLNDNFTSFFNMVLFTQDPYDVWGRLTEEEKDLVKSFPLQAYQIFKNRSIAENATQIKFGYNGRNDKSDAFRHAYFNAINTMDIGSYMAELFSNAHESEVPNNLILEKQMDLFNNAVGHDAQIDFTNHTDSQLINDVYQVLLNGGLRYLSPIDNIASPPYDLNRDGVQDCLTCLNGIISSTELTPTNQ